jgi:putative transposase
VSERFRLVQAEKALTPVKVSCELLEVYRSGYYDWERRSPSQRELSDVWILEKIKQIHAENRGVYGAPRIHAELGMAYGIRIGRKRVERLMRAVGISGLVKKKRGKTTLRVPGVRVADDLLLPDFTAIAPNMKWVADITYLKSWQGWVCLAAVQDLYSRRIVGWSMADHMRAELVTDAFEMAIKRRWPDPGQIYHSDQGSQLGFKGSSQHLDLGGAYESSTRLGEGVDREGSDAAARPGSLLLLETMALCRELTGNEVPLSADLETRPGDVPVYLSGCSHLHSLTSWRPDNKPREVLTDLLAWSIERENSLRSALNLDR